MLSRGDVASIRAEIERLEKALNVCTDGGIRERIEAWIEEEKKKLMKAAPTCHICGKPCPPEDCVTDSQGRTLHKKCYREALIEGQESL
jgi:hypothetical protein